MTNSERGVWQVIMRTILTGGSYDEAKQAGEVIGDILGVPRERVLKLLESAWSTYGS